MGATLIILLGITFLLSIPFTTALFARRMGRLPLLWFFIGCLLPVVAVIILFFLPDNSINKIKTKKQ